MTLAQIADKNPNCNGTAADTGTLGCQIEFGTPLHAIALRKGTVIPAATVFDKVYIDTQIQLGVFIPLVEADSFEETSSEDTFNTNTRGVDRLSVLGLPKYKLTFQQGHEFYKQIARLTSFKSMDFIFGDDSGNWKLAVNGNGDFEGFSAGQVTSMMTKTKVQGGDPESKAISVQMLDRDQWDKNYAILGRTSLTFSPGEIGGINGVEIVLAPIVAASTALTIEVALASDRVTPVSGLLLADFLVTANGVKVVPTSVTEDVAIDGKYVFVVPANTAGKKIVVSTYDDATKTLAILSEGVLFRGTSNTVTVA